MRTAGLAWTAAIFALLLLSTAYLAADRLGYLREWEEPGWVFENRLLEIEPRTVMFVRPAQAGATDGRIVLLGAVTEPDPQSQTRAPNAHLPHVVVGVQARHPDGESWRPPELGHWALGQLGALTSKEWLAEIRLVREKREEGGDRILLRVGFQHETGASTSYFYDPDPKEAAKYPLGWFRTERAGPGESPDIDFAYPGGVIR